jgi:hypothetical protein
LVIFFGGGNIKILFTDFSNAQQFIRDLQKCFINEAPSVHFSNIIYEFEDDFNNEIIEKVEKELQKIKLSKKTLINVNTNPLFKLCDICRKYPANYVEPFEDGEIEICASCYNCLKTYRNYRNLNDEILLKLFYNQYLQEFNAGFEESFDFIKDKKGFMAVIIMDGNSFGERIAEITKGKRNDECIRTLKKFSETLNKKIPGLLLDSLDGILTREDINKKKKISFRPIIIGGDDICIIMAADKAFSFIENFNKNVTDDEFFKSNSLSYSIGVAVTKSHFPFHLAHKISEQLLKNAKVKRGRKSINMLDWEILHSSVFDDLSEIRKEIYHEEHASEQYQLTYKPYNFLDGDIRYFGHLKEATSEMRQILGNSKFKNLRKIIRMPKQLANYEFRKMISKLSKAQKKNIENLLHKFNLTPVNIWHEVDHCLYNNFLDFVELSDFITKKGNIND